MHEWCCLPGSVYTLHILPTQHQRTCGALELCRRVELQCFTATLATLAQLP